MSEPLEIPEHVLWKGRDAYYGVDTTQSSVDGVEAAIRVVAPLVIAAELRALVDELHRLWLRGASLAEGLARVRRRLAERDPDGRAL